MCPHFIFSIYFTKFVFPCFLSFASILIGRITKAYDRPANSGTSGRGRAQTSLPINPGVMAALHLCMTEMAETLFLYESTSGCGGHAEWPCGFSVCEIFDRGRAELSSLSPRSIVSLRGAARGSAADEPAVPAPNNAAPHDVQNGSADGMQVSQNQLLARGLDFGNSAEHFRRYVEDLDLASDMREIFFSR
jgi:hypothetical protein